MLQHVVAQEDEKIFAFGWDQPRRSFFLQVFDTTRPENDQIIVWLGNTDETKMYEVEDLVREANKNGLIIDYPTQVKLYGEKDDGV